MGDQSLTQNLYPINFLEVITAMRKLFPILLLLSFLLCFSVASASAQTGTNAPTAKGVIYGSSLPSTCDPTDNNIFVLTGTPSAAYVCTAANTFRKLVPVLTGSASLDFGVVNANTCADLTATVTGAADGDPVDIGVPNALSSITGLTFRGFVSAANTVTVRACNVTGSNSSDPAAATVKISVLKQ